VCPGKIGRLASPWLAAAPAPPGGGDAGSVARMGAVFGGLGRFRARGAEWQGAGAKCPAAGRGPMKG